MTNQIHSSDNTVDEAKTDPLRAKEPSLVQVDSCDMLLVEINGKLLVEAKSISSDLLRAEGTIPARRLTILLHRPIREPDADFERLAAGPPFLVRLLWCGIGRSAISTGCTVDEYSAQTNVCDGKIYSSERVVIRMPWQPFE